MTSDADGPRTITTDLTPVERRLAHLRAIHAVRTHCYDEDSMHALHQFQHLQHAASCADLPHPDAIDRRMQLVAEGVALVAALDAGISEALRQYTQRVREILTALGDT